MKFQLTLLLIAAIASAADVLPVLVTFGFLPK